MANRPTSAYSNRSSAYFFLPLRRTITVSLARSAGVSRRVDAVDAAVVDVGAALLDRAAGFAFALGEAGCDQGVDDRQPPSPVSAARGERLGSARRRRFRRAGRRSRSAISAPKKISVARWAAARPASPWTSRVSSSARRVWLSRAAASAARGGVERFDLLARQLGEQPQARCRRRRRRR